MGPKLAVWGGCGAAAEALGKGPWAERQDADPPQAHARAGGAAQAVGLSRCPAMLDPEGWGWGHLPQMRLQCGSAIETPPSLDSPSSGELK